MSLSHSTLRLLHKHTAEPDDVLVVGAEVKRTNFAEGALTVAAVNKAAGIVVLRREGASSWIHRGIGSRYTSAAHMVCRFWTVPVKGTNRHETWCEQICSAPIKKGAETI